MTIDNGPNAADIVARLFGTENKTKTYDKYDFIVAYVRDGCLEIEEESRLLEAQKNTRIGNKLESVLENLRNDYEDETGDYDDGFMFQSIYKGCKRIRIKDND